MGNRVKQKMTGIPTEMEIVLFDSYVYVQHVHLFVLRSLNFITHNIENRALEILKGHIIFYQDDRITRRTGPNATRLRSSLQLQSRPSLRDAGAHGVGGRIDCRDREHRKAWDRQRGAGLHAVRREAGKHAAEPVGAEFRAPA